MSPLDLAAQNLLSPMVLFFALGLLAALARSDLTIPEAVAKTMALYLMMAIGFKGGAEVAARGLDTAIVLTMAAGAVLSFVLPFVGFVLLKATTRLDRVNAAAVAAHYGSISIVTFVAGTQMMAGLGLNPEGFLVAVAAVMETPAIIAALMIARAKSSRTPRDEDTAGTGELMREILLNGSVVMLVGAFIIGWITGPAGLERVAPFIVAPFQGVLCLFLLDMGLVAGRGLKSGAKSLTAGVIAFGLYMPLIGALVALPFAWALPLSTGGAALLITLAASASYIAVPAALRIALPESKPSIYLTLSLGVTFPFNLTIGLPLYAALAQLIKG